MRRKNIEKIYMTGLLIGRAVCKQKYYMDALSFVYKKKLISTITPV